MNALLPLKELAARGLQPVGRIVWLGLGFLPQKRNALEIDPNHLPCDADCLALAGLDVILLIRGYSTSTKYGAVKRLCGSVYRSRPRRFQLIDLDLYRIAYLKKSGVH